MTFPQPDSMTFELIISCIRIHFNEKMQYKFIVNPNILILAQKHLGTFTGKQCSIKQQYKIQNNFKSVSKLEDKWSLWQWLNQVFISQNSPRLKKKEFPDFKKLPKISHYLPNHLLSITINPDIPFQSHDQDNINPE